jgi:phosphoglycerol transferase MdoB-like AlkP superfamily enzyme
MNLKILARTLLAILALFVLNASLAFGNVWPSPRIRWINAFSVEVAACVLLLAVVLRTKQHIHRGALAVVWLVLVIGHYVDVTAPGLYGRDFNIYWDSRHLVNVAAMLTRDVPRSTLLLVAGGTIAGLAAAWAVVWICLGCLAAAMRDKYLRPVFGVAATIVVALFAGQRLSAAFPTRVPFADPVLGSFARQARYVAGMVGPNRMAPALGASPVLNIQLEELRRADVLLIFLESYGAVTFDNPEFSSTLAKSRELLASEISAAGRRVVSAYVESPTFGGSSWLAHLSLLSGVEVRDEYANVSLMAQNRKTLVTTFALNGYRTVALMPGIRQEWPEGAFYRFDAIYNFDAMEYQGPKFGWWSIPDQYTLAKLDAAELHAGTRAPVFVVFPTATTHAPFGPVAPYQPDWSRMLTPAPYDKSDLERALAATPSLTNLAPSYLRAMSYEFESLAGYVRQHAKDNQVVIIIGDHQPAAAVSGRNARWDVPVHVIAGDSKMMDQLLNDGFSEGLNPRRPALGKMHTLVPMFLNAFTGAHTKLMATDYTDFTDLRTTRD